MVHDRRYGKNLGPASRLYLRPEERVQSLLRHGAGNLDLPVLGCLVSRRARARWQRNGTENYNGNRGHVLHARHSDSCERLRLRSDVCVGK